MRLDLELVRIAKMGTMNIRRFFHHKYGMKGAQCACVRELLSSREGSVGALPEHLPLFGLYVALRAHINDVLRSAGFTHRV